MPTPYEEHKIRGEVRKRDGYKCTECGVTAEEHLRVTGWGLDVHRINPGSEYTLNGCVTLCRRCHGPKEKSRRITLGQKIPLVVNIRPKTRGLYRSAASCLGISVSEFLEIVSDKYVRPWLIKRINKEFSEEGHQ